MKVEERWPTSFQIRKINDNVLSKAMTVFLIIGVVNEKQAQEELLNKALDLHAEFKIGDDQFVIASLVTEDRLENLYEVFKPRAKGKYKYSGQYLPLARELVRICEEGLDKNV